MRASLEQYFDRLWPINRSLTGNGNRESLKILSEVIDIKTFEVPSGTQCFDWTVPPEWNVKEAWLKDSKGNVIADFAVNNLHLLGYSEPFKGQLSYEELAPHLNTLPEQPDLIPYLTSYYKRRWGFCITHEQFLQLNKEETYEVLIDSTLDEKGSMTIGEAIIEGQSKKEILFSTYICHPSLAMNELSGPLITSFLYSKVKELGNLKYTYRFIFVPETIGSIYFLAQKGEHLKENLHAGFVVTCVGDAGAYTYKKSRQGDTMPDRAVMTILDQTEGQHKIIDFFPYGSDERQYCSPGFNLPVGSLMRTMYGRYKEYHTSGDNKDIISFEAMEHTVGKYLEVIELLEKNEYYVNLLPFCEPQLGKRDLYPTLGSQQTHNNFIESMMWILNLADGENDLIDISNRSGVAVKDLFPVIDTLLAKEVIKKK